MTSDRQRSPFLQSLVILVVLTVAAVVWIQRTAHAPADGKALKNHVEDLIASISEAQALIQEDRREHRLSSSQRARFHQLAEKIVKTEAALGKAKPEPALVSPYRDTAGLAGSAASVIAPLSSPSESSDAFSPEAVAQGVLPGIRARLVAIQAKLEK